MVERQEVEALLAIADSQPLDEPVPTATLAALCRAWLAVQEAPQLMVGDGIRYGVSVAGTGIANGQRVRIVKEVGDD